MMKRFVKKPLEQFFLSGLENVPIVSFYAKTRGWPYVIAWIHRISGLLMVLYIWVHIYTLSFLATPDAYDAKMKRFGFFPFSLLEWLLALPVIFHALNGGRLILYEIFGMRNDESMIRWVLGLSAAYFLLLGWLMAMGNQTVSPIIFGLIIFVLGILPGWLVASKIWNVAASTAWKLQRISGAYLIVMIPAHLLFMHLQPAAGHEAGIVIARMQNGFIKFIDLTLVIAALYHAGYGLTVIIRDYLKTRLLQTALACLIFLMMAVFGWMGIKLTLTI
ncbi:MAG: succinate dehydrogenase, hydrophobic membrane anchor protein [Desulfobacterales bacterium]|jgi:succinate dehydrogenase / fumarate reductase cytochrome b subunit